MSKRKKLLLCGLALCIVPASYFDHLYVWPVVETFFGG